MESVNIEEKIGLIFINSLNGCGGDFLFGVFVGRFGFAEKISRGYLLGNVSVITIGKFNLADFGSLAVAIKLKAEPTVSVVIVSCGCFRLIVNKGGSFCNLAVFAVFKNVLGGNVILAIVLNDVINRAVFGVTITENCFDRIAKLWFIDNRNALYQPLFIIGVG